MGALKRSGAWSEYVGLCAPLWRIASTTIRAPQGGTPMPKGIYQRAPRSIRTCAQCEATFSVVQSSKARCCSNLCKYAHAKRPLAERFWEKVIKHGPIPEHRPYLGPCWGWLGAHTGDGYGNFTVSKGHFRPAHVIAYELMIGPVPSIGHRPVLDHLCRNRGCSNPWHLEPVTNRVNIIRGTGFAAVHAQATPLRQRSCVHA